jgi:hypothetical protein
MIVVLPLSYHAHCKTSLLCNCSRQPVKYLRFRAGERDFLLIPPRLSFHPNPPGAHHMTRFDTTMEVVNGNQ